MKKIILITCLSIICILSLHAQMLKQGNRWNDEKKICLIKKCAMCTGCNITTISYFIGKDTLYNNKPYKILFDTSYGGPDTLNFVKQVTKIYCFIREENNKIYYIPRRAMNNIEYLLYDFNLKKDSVFVLKNNIINNDTFKVTAVDSIIYSGIKRLTIHLSGKYGSMDWIEGVGTKKGLLYNNSAEFLLCFYENNVLKYKLDSNLSCMEVSFFTSVNELKNINQIKVFPNPAEDLLNVRSSQIIEQAELYDIYGNKLEFITPKESNFNINLSGIAKGIYLLKLNTAENVSITKVSKH